MAILAAENWASNYDIQDLEYQNHFPNNIDCSKILDSLLDESQEDYYYNEDDERLNNLIQSLEAEITYNSNQAEKTLEFDQLSCSSLEYNLMDMGDSSSSSITSNRLVNGSSHPHCSISSSSSNADNAYFDDGESSAIEAFDMLDFEETKNYTETEMMCQRVPFVEDFSWEETDETCMLN